MTDIPTREQVQVDIDEAEKWGIGPALQKRLIAVARVALPHLPTQHTHGRGEWKGQNWCDECDGGGQDDYSLSQEACPKCGGTGTSLQGLVARETGGRLMIRPCDQCGGSGEVHPSDGWDTVSDPCSRCTDMPRLKCDQRHWSEDDGTNEPCWRCGYGPQKREHRGWFKPDPSTVMKWCLEHKSRWYITWLDQEPRCCMAEVIYVSTKPELCRWSWQPTPGPGLEETQ